MLFNCILFYFDFLNLDDAYESRRGIKIPDSHVPSVVAAAVPCFVESKSFELDEFELGEFDGKSLMIDRIT